MFSCLKNSAQQFYKREGSWTLLYFAGYPWFGAGARDQFIALPGCTLTIDRMDYWTTSENFARRSECFLFERRYKTLNCWEIDDPDVLLWLIGLFSNMLLHTSLKEAADRFENIATEIITFIRNKITEPIPCTTMALLYVNGKENL